MTARPSSSRTGPDHVDQREDEVLVERVEHLRTWWRVKRVQTRSRATRGHGPRAHQPGDPQLREAAVDEEQAREVLELAQREVGGVRGLDALAADDADADVRLLDHAHVVRAVADRQRDLADVLLDERDDLRLLAGRDPAADDRGALQAGGDQRLGACSGRKPPKRVVTRPPTPQKTAMERRFTVESAKGA
jgi:hypothetical protein